jgi:hypothetical protein
MYNLATKHKLAGDNVTIVDMHPELAFNADVHNTNGDIKYNENILVSDSGMTEECGNFSAERLVKPVVRSGLPRSILESALEYKGFNKIIICDMGSTADAFSSSAYYSNLGISEVIDVINKSGYTGEILVSGKYSKIFKDTGGFNKFYDVDCELIDTDLSLIPYRPRRIGISTSLGYNDNCFFGFAKSLESDNATKKSADKVIRFIDYVVSMGYKKIRLMDNDILGLWDVHMKDIFNRIIAKKYGLAVSSYCGHGASSVTDEIMEKSLAVGFKDIVIPLEDVDSWKKAVAITKKYFSNISSYVMIGLPGQTKEAAIGSISMCVDSGVTPALMPFTPLDGTIYEDNKLSPDKKHPLLFPYAWDKFTVFDMEYLLEKYNTWYKKNTVKLADDIKVYKTTGKPILINGEK